MDHDQPDDCDCCARNAEYVERLKALLMSAAQWLHATAPLHARAPEIRELADKINEVLK